MFKIRKSITVPKPNKTQEKKLDKSIINCQEESINNIKKDNLLNKSIYKIDDIATHKLIINLATLKDKLINSEKHLESCKFLNLILKTYTENSFKNKNNLRKQINNHAQELKISPADLDKLLPKDNYVLKYTKLSKHLEALLLRLANESPAKFYLATYGINSTLIEHIKMSEYLFENITFISEDNIVTGYYNQKENTKIKSESDIKGRINFFVPMNGNVEKIYTKLNNLLKLFLIFNELSDTQVNITRVKFRTKESLEKVLLSNTTNLAVMHLATNNQITIYMESKIDLLTIKSYLNKLDEYLVYYEGIENDSLHSQNESKFGSDTRLNGCSYTSFRNETKTFDNKINIEDITEKQIHSKIIIDLIHQYNLVPSTEDEHYSNKLKYLLIKIYNDNKDIRNLILETLQKPQL